MREIKGMKDEQESENVRPIYLHCLDRVEFADKELVSEEGSVE